REDDLFNRQTGGVNADLAGQTVAFAGDDSTSSDSGVSARPGPRGKVRGGGKTPVSRELTIRFRFYYGPKDEFAGRDPGSYRFWLLDSKDTVAQEDWTRVPPDKSATNPSFYSESELTFFRSPESDFVLQFRLFPFDFQNVSQAQ